MLYYQTPTLISGLWIKVFLIYPSWQILSLFLLFLVISNQSIYMHSRPSMPVNHQLEQVKTSVWLMPFIKFP